MIRYYMLIHRILYKNIILIYFFSLGQNMRKIMMGKKKKNVFKTLLLECVEMQDLHEILFN